MKLMKMQQINMVKIPVSAEVIWKLKEGDYSYAKFDVIELYTISIFLK